MYFQKIGAVDDYVVKSQRLCIPFAIVHSATPANKTNSNDLSAAMVLALEGQTATAAAIDSGTNFPTPTDSTGVFGVLLYNLGTIYKLHNYDIKNLSSGTAVVSANGASSSGVTASGNIAVSVDWSGSLASTDLSAVLIVDFILLSN